MSYFMAYSLMENAYLQVRSSIMVVWNDLGVYDMLSRIINTRTHHFIKTRNQASLEYDK
jgi:hypothetical protein